MTWAAAAARIAAAGTLTRHRPPSNHHGGNMLTPEQILRFDANLDKSRGACGCWMWVAGGNGRGYGQVRDGRKMRTTHRVAYEIAFGPLVVPQLVLHLCDTPRCCNPLHLVAGTHKQNMEHRTKRGRDFLCGHGGPRHYKTRFTEAQVHAIRADRRKQQVIADEYGVAQSMISRLKSRKTWRTI